jgi:hypothetical protein
MVDDASFNSDATEDAVAAKHKQEDWVELVDNGGATILVNRITGDVRGLTSNPVIRDDDGDISRTSWNAVTDNLSGNKYYHHPRTGITSLHPHRVPKTTAGKEKRRGSQRHAGATATTAAAAAVSGAALANTAVIDAAQQEQEHPDEFDDKADGPMTWDARRVESQFGNLVRKGWLSLRKSVKRTHMFGNWEKRWVELRQGGLSVWNKQPLPLLRSPGLSSSSSSLMSPKRVIRFTAETRHEAMIFECANSREKIGVVLSGYDGDVPIYLVSLEEFKEAADKEAFGWNDDLRTCLEMFSVDRTRALVQDVEALRSDVVFWREVITPQLAPDAFWSTLGSAIRDFTADDAEIIRAMFTKTVMGEEDVYEREAALLAALHPLTPASDDVLDTIQNTLVEEVDVYRRELHMTLPQVKLMLAAKTEHTKHALARWL